MAVSLKYFYSGLLTIALLGITTWFFYRTEPLVVSGDTAEMINVAGGRAKFGGVSLRIEYATTTVAREFGLGGRKSIEPDEAMLFVFSEDDYYGFWMKDMLVPIDIFWLDYKGQVVHIERDVATSTYPNVFYPSVPARYVLETAAGFARERAVATGSPLLLKNPQRVSK